MAEQSLKDKTARGLFWGGISNGLQQVFSLVFGIILARILNAEDYGMIGMLAIFSAIASSILESGFTNALANKTTFSHEDYNAVFWFNVLSGILLYILLFFLSPLIAEFYRKPELVGLSRVVFLGFLFGSIGTAQHAYLFKNVMVKEQAQITIIALVFSGITGVLLALSGFSYWGLAIQSALYAGISTILRWYFSPWHPTMQINFIPLKEMFGFSSKLFFSNIFYQINNNIFSVLLGKFYNATQVGHYTQGQKWMSMGQTFIGSMINSVAQPILAQVVEDKERQLNVLRKMLRFGAFISFPLMLGLAFVGEEFIVISIGEKWRPAVPFLQLFCIWGAFAYLWTLFSNLLMTHGKSNIYMWITISTGLLQLLIIFFMFPYGVLPMLVAYLSIFFVGLLLQSYFVYYLIHLSTIDVLKDIIPYLSITLISFFFTWLVSKNIDSLYLSFGVKIIMSACLYILIMWKMDSVVFKECILYLKGKNRT